MTELDVIHQAIQELGNDRAYFAEWLFLSNTRMKGADFAIAELKRRAKLGFEDDKRVVARATLIRMTK